MKTVLQILQWYRPRERWVLKSPQHLEQLGPLLRDLPRRHRRGDPPRPGGRRPVHDHHGLLRRPHRLPHDPARVVPRLLDRAHRRACSTPRCATGTSCPSDRTVDVSSTSTWPTRSATLERVYDCAGIELTEQARAEVADYQRRPPERQGGQGRLRPASRLLHHARGGAVPLRGLPRPFPRPNRGRMNIAGRRSTTSSTPARARNSCARSTTIRPTPSADGHLPLGRLHRGLHAADRHRAGHRQHRHGLRGAAPQAGLRRHPARPDPLHRHHPGPRRPRRRGRPVQGDRTPSTSPRRTTRPARPTTPASAACACAPRASGSTRWARTLAASPQENPGVSMRQSEPVPDVTFERAARARRRRPRHRAHRGRGGDDRQPRSSGCPSGARRWSATSSVRSSLTSRTSTRCGVTATASSSPTWRACARSAHCGPTCSSPAATTPSSGRS